MNSIEVDLGETQVIEIAAVPSTVIEVAQVLPPSVVDVLAVPPSVVDVLSAPPPPVIEVLSAPPPPVIEVLQVPSTTVIEVVGGIQGPPGITQPFRIGHTWALVGDLTTLGALPSMFVPMLGTQAATLVEVRAKVTSGGSIDVQLRRNGSNVGSPLRVTTTATTFSLGNVPVAANDELSLLLSSPIGSPAHLGATLVLEHTP